MKISSSRNKRCNNWKLFYRKENGKKKQYRTYFIVNEDKASQARIRAMQRALEETQAAQQYAKEISAFVQEDFENNQN